MSLYLVKLWHGGKKSRLFSSAEAAQNMNKYLTTISFLFLLYYFIIMCERVEISEEKLIFFSFCYKLKRIFSVCGCVYALICTWLQSAKNVYIKLTHDE